MNGQLHAKVETYVEGLRTVSEAMAFTRLSRTGVYGLMESGQLPYVKLGRRRLIPAAALLALVQQNMVEAPKARVE